MDAVFHETVPAPVWADRVATPDMPRDLQSCFLLVFDSHRSPAIGALPFRSSKYRRLPKGWNGASHPSPVKDCQPVILIETQELAQAIQPPFSLQASEVRSFGGLIGISSMTDEYRAGYAFSTSWLLICQ